MASGSGRLCMIRTVNQTPSLLLELLLALYRETIRTAVNPGAFRARRSIVRHSRVFESGPDERAAVTKDRVGRDALALASR